MAAIKQAVLLVNGSFHFHQQPGYAQKCDSIRDRKIIVLSLSCLFYPELN